MMAEFNVGDKVRVTCRGENLPRGTEVTIKSGPIGPVDGGNYYFYENDEVILGDNLELVIDKPKKSARITALESQVAELQAKVEALEAQSKPAQTHYFADSFPLTAKFESDNAADEIMAEIKRKATPALTPNQQRADVIKRAQAFVAEHTKHDMKYVITRRLLCKAEFHVNTEKRAVTFLAKGSLSDNVYAKGIAKCDPDDVFNESIGKAIALARALGVDVPVEFVKAVQPTEADVGMKVKRVGGFGTNNRERTLTGLAFSSGTHVSFKTKEGCGATAIENIAKILDDTDAVYE